jgi:hypothetical protein
MSFAWSKTKYESSTIRWNEKLLKSESQLLCHYIQPNIVKTDAHGKMNIFLKHINIQTMVNQAYNLPIKYLLKTKFK